MSQQKDHSFYHVLIILAIALSLGLYLICTTVSVSRDSVTFINFAEDLQADFKTTLLNNFQHPGYPVMIASVKPVFSMLGFNEFWSWNYSAQAVSLTFRLAALVCIYFLGKLLVGSQASFWAVIVLIFLPESMQTGSDALSEWPHIFFLLGSFLLLYLALTWKRWYMMASAGIVAGLGYLVRPECSQVVVYGLVSCFVYFIFYKQLQWSRIKLGMAAVLLVSGFLICAVPYMSLKDAVFPKKSFDTQLTQVVPNPTDTVIMTSASFADEKVFGAAAKLMSRLFETTIVFTPFLLLGLWLKLRNKSLLEPDKLLFSLAIGFNVFILLWLHSRFGYISRRHMLPLIALTICYIPAGIEGFIGWISNLSSEKKPLLFFQHLTARKLFIGIILLGIAVSLPRALRCVGYNKAGIRATAKWLEANTRAGDSVICSDPRIAFYAGREQVDKAETVYVVRKIKKDKGLTAGQAVWSDENDKHKPYTVFKSSNQE